MITNTKVKCEIEKLIEMFKSPESLELVAKGMFSRGANIPSDNWSYLNRIIMLSHGYTDARGFKAWGKVGRQCSKGGCFYILAPNLFKKKVVNKKTNIEEEKTILAGFRPIPVWPLENTTGKEVTYKDQDKMPDFMGIEIAEKWGIKITQGFQNPSYYAYYSPIRKEIKMATASQQTFFHELAHAADDRLNKNLKGGQDPIQEIVAETSAVVLMSMLGLKAGTKNAYDYVKRYANQSGKDPADSIIPLISRIGKIIKLILDESDSLQKTYKKVAKK